MNRLIDFEITATHRVAVAVVLTLFVTAVLSAAGVPVTDIVLPADPIPASLVRARVAAEVENARTLGFEEDRRVSSGRPALRVQLRIGAGECVAVVAGASGPRRVRTVNVLPRGVRSDDMMAEVYHPEALAAHADIRGLVGALQWCSAEARSVGVEVLTEKLRFDVAESPLSVELVVLRAPLSRVGSPSRLNRGVVLVSASSE